MTSKTRTLTDPDGDKLRLIHLTDGMLSVRTMNADEEGLSVHLDPAAVITAIREVTGTPEPAPSTPPTPKDFSRARFAEVDGEPVARKGASYDLSLLPWRANGVWRSDLWMATLARAGRARIIREAPTDPVALFGLAWEAACVVPEGVEIPGAVPVITRWSGGTVHLYAKGYGYPVSASTVGVERRTLTPLTPLPAPRPEGAEGYEPAIRAEAPGLDDATVQAIADRIAREVGA